MVGLEGAEGWRNPPHFALCPWLAPLPRRPGSVMTPDDFIRPWDGEALWEKQASQEHLLTSTYLTTYSLAFTVPKASSLFTR